MCAIRIVPKPCATLQLTKSVILGVFLAVFLFAACAGVAAWFGWKSMSKVKPFEFPAVSAEIARDAAAISEALAPPAPIEDVGPAPGDEAAVADLEERRRRGSE